MCVNAHWRRGKSPLDQGGVYTVHWAGEVELPSHVLVIYPDGTVYRGGRHHVVELVEVKNRTPRHQGFCATRFRPLRSTKKGMETLREIIEKTKLPEKV